MSPSLEFGTIKQIGAVVIAVAIVLAAGTVVGQAPEIFGADVADDPEASIEFTDQNGDGTGVTIDSVSLSDGGFVVVTTSSDVVGVSEHLEAGTHENVTVEQAGDDDIEMLGQLRATVHQDITDDQTFVPADDEGGEDGGDGEHDRPYIDGGYPVSDTATVTMGERPDDGSTNTSFIVESVDAPGTVTMNESFDVTATIRNPNEFQERQHVELRLEGDLYERQILTLEPDETREVTVTLELADVEIGDTRYGIYTTDGGQLGELFVESDRPANVTIRETGTGHVVADAHLPTDGFLAVEDDDGSVIGTSAPLEAGDHENVTVDLETTLEAGETMTVVAYEGEPDAIGGGDDVEGEATPFEADGERAEASAVVGEAAGTENESEGGDERDDVRNDSDAGDG